MQTPCTNNCNYHHVCLYPHLVTNEEVRAKIQQMQTAVILTCLLFIRSGKNHLARHSGRGRSQGRQRKRWEDNIREWTGLEFTKSQTAVKNKEKWGKLVAKSSVVPQ